MNATNPKLSREESAATELLMLRLLILVNPDNGILCSVPSEARDAVRPFIESHIIPLVHSVMTAPGFRTFDDRCVLAGASREFHSLKSLGDIHGIELAGVTLPGGLNTKDA